MAKENSATTEAGTSSASNYEVNRRKFVMDRAVFKRKITLALKKLESADSSPSIKASSKEAIETHLRAIESIDHKINTSMSDHSNNEMSEALAEEIDAQSEYHLDISSKLKEFATSAPTSNGHVTHDLKLPNLSCGSFSGEGSGNLEFFNFITQFKNVIGFRTNISDSTKLIYLRSFLKGYAFKVIQHLQNDNANYKVAMDMLEAEFLNKDGLIDDLFKKLMSAKAKTDASFVETKMFITEIRCLLSDLDNYGCKLRENESALKLVSHIVFSRLPLSFRQEIARKLSNNYPSVNEIFDNYVDIIKTLTMKGAPSKTDSVQITPPVESSSTIPTNVLGVVNTTENFATYNSNNNRKSDKRVCRLCSNINHVMTDCPKYNTYPSRVARCEELHMCSVCSSTKHTSTDCPGTLRFGCNACKSKLHITALCPDMDKRPTVSNYCINAFNVPDDYILPTYTVTIRRGDRTVEVRCLLDSGSQKSYLSQSVLRQLGLSRKLDNKLLVNTFLGSGEKSFAVTGLYVDFMNGLGKYPLPFWEAEDFYMGYEVEGLSSAVENMRSNGVEFADKYYSEGGSGDYVRLNGILGINCVQMMTGLTVGECLRGKSWNLGNKVIPIGNVDHFLSDEEISRIAESNSPSNKSVVQSVVNFVMNPRGKEPDLISSLVGDLSSVEPNLDPLYSLESLGIKEEISDYDVRQIDKFKSNIECRDNRYFVELPWNSKVNSIQSNFKIACAVLNRVVSKLHAEGVYDQYNEVFENQKTDGVLEEIDLSTINVHDKTWIPHRAVLKHDAQTTTKVRVVLNCSVKTDSFPSLNEAAYPGVDLMENLLKLLLMIRTNNYFVSADISKAFLQIRLKLESDKDKFYILWRKKDGSLTAFRYCSIVFGFVSSPFILNYIIKHHVEKYPQNECTKILGSQFYVDNLFFTGNCPKKLNDLYLQAQTTMAEGGFILRSWMSNCPELSAQFQDDGNCTSHGSDYEKVLGYNYSKEDDKLSVVIGDSTLQSYTKRGILSILSKVFDPLGVYLPVTVRGKLLMRKLWASGLDWDEEISDELRVETDRLLNDLSQLKDISFDRRVVIDGECCSLVILRYLHLPLLMCCETEKQRKRRKPVSVGCELVVVGRSAPRVLRLRAGEVVTSKFY